MTEPGPTATHAAIAPVAASPSAAGPDATGPDAPGPDATDSAASAGVADLPFDAALAELQGVVGRLEQGNLPLEESIALYERGVALHEHCARLLTGAELRVQRLVESAGGALRALDLTPDDADEG
jgi:exodeoxyribonuclease VII small subunit